MFERRFPLLISALVIVLIITPYLFAVQMNNADSVFGGFLINPIDGHSYLAKMQQGMRGEWRFVLPYTAEAGNGAFLFLFYLGLGHLGRILNLPLIILFHSVRIVGAILLLGVLYLFNKKLFIEQRYQNLGFAICALGSGLGWIAIFAGLFSSDFWVAEAYPFLSMYTNPHFSIGLSLMILALMPERKSSVIADLCLGVGLGIIQPFAVVIVLIVKAGKIIVDGIERKGASQRIFNSGDLFPTIAFAFGGGGILVYQYWSILSDPVLALWNSQNITVSPQIADLIISLSPTLVLAGVGIKTAWQKEKGRSLVIWAVVSLVLVLIPWNLQRRFLTGIYVPLVGLAVYGLIDLERTKRLSFRFSAIVILVLVIPTNIIVLVSGIQAAARHDPKIYQDREIYYGLTWINENTSPDVLVLTDEGVGLFIPSITGRRVIYGHPFETINAEMEKKFLLDFIDENQDDLYFERKISERGIDVLFLLGEVSESLERWIYTKGLKPEYEYDRVRIYQVGRND